MSTPTSPPGDPARPAARPDARSPTEPADRRPADLGWFVRRRERIAAEVARNRRGGHKVPTWVLAAVLLLIVGAWATLIVVS
nr:hypothetical protein [Micromonospora sp. DSM 115978]